MLNTDEHTTLPVSSLPLSDSNLLNTTEDFGNQTQQWYNETSSDWLSTTLLYDNGTYNGTPLTIGLSCGSAGLVLIIAVVVIILIHMRRSMHIPKEPSVRCLTLYDSLSMGRSPAAKKSGKGNVTYVESVRRNNIGASNESYLSSTSDLDRISRCEEVYQLKPLCNYHSPIISRACCYSTISEIPSSDGDSYILRPTDSTSQLQVEDSPCNGRPSCSKYSNGFLPVGEGLTLEQITSNVKRISRLSPGAAAAIANLRVSETFVLPSAEFQNSALGRVRDTSSHGVLSADSNHHFTSEQQKRETTGLGPPNILKQGLPNFGEIESGNQSNYSASSMMTQSIFDNNVKGKEALTYQKPLLFIRKGQQYNYCL